MPSRDPVGILYARKMKDAVKTAFYRIVNPGRFQQASRRIRPHDKALNVMFLGDRHQFVDDAANEMLAD